MGNQNAKTRAQTHLSDAELKVLDITFRAACGGLTDKLLKEKLLDFWSALIDPHLAQCTANFIFSITTGGHQRIHSVNLVRYAEPYYMVERGSIDEKLVLLCGSMEKTDSNQYAIKQLENYVSGVLKSYLKIQCADPSSANFKSWTDHGYQSAERTVFAFAKSLLRDLSKDNEHFVYVEQLERWLQEHSNFLLIWKEVFAYIYSKNANKSQKLGSPNMVQILPAMEGDTHTQKHMLICLNSGTNYTPILDLPHLIFINSNLPNAVRHKWRFLFSSKIMGESFSTMLGKIQNRGATLFIVEDEDQFIFAGYAPEHWALRPAFVGDDTSMLFTLSPVMRCFNATGYNNHYQYLNLNQQTMPNGLGMGGQFNYWGLWLDSEYGQGQSSETCTTYRDYVQLSKRKEFRIHNLEVWGIGDIPKSGDSDDEEEGNTKKSILDKNLEDKVMLELSGRQMHSDGFREPDMDL